MKKTYETPYLIVEAFQLDSDIASCSGDGGVSINQYLNNCMLDGAMYFASFCDEEGGSDVTNPNDSYDTICYQTVQGDTTFLSS